MGSLKWDKRLEFGIKEIDFEHFKLLEIVNTFLTHATQGKSHLVIKQTFKQLRDYAFYHFKDEERVMGESNYPDLLEHKRQHDHFRLRVKDYTLRLYLGEDIQLGEMKSFLGKWLLEHLLVHDTKFKEYLNAMPSGAVVGPAVAQQAPQA